MSQAIARAVYARRTVAIFDDVFSGLDKVTEQVVFARVFGRSGLLRQRGTTIILATHAGKQPSTHPRTVKRPSNLIYD